jgi:hypothetical protein
MEIPDKLLRFWALHGLQIRATLFGLLVVAILTFGVHGCATAAPGSLEHMKREAFHDCSNSKYKYCMAVMKDIDRNQCSVNTLGCDVYIGGKPDHDVCRDWSLTECRRYLR